MRLTDGLIAGVEQGHGLGVILRAKAFLFSGFRVFNVERAAELAVIQNETAFHKFKLSVRSYETERSTGCISYTNGLRIPSS